MDAFETVSMTAPICTRFLVWFDANIGTDREINDSGDGRKYVVCFEMTPAEFRRTAEKHMELTGKKGYAL